MRCGHQTETHGTGARPAVPRVRQGQILLDIPQGEGRGILFDMSQKQYWGASKFATAPTSKTGPRSTPIFLSQDDGTGRNRLCAGIPLRRHDQRRLSTGTVYFDNVSVVKVTDELFMQESEHIRLFVEPSQVYASAKQITEWLAISTKCICLMQN